MKIVAIVLAAMLASTTAFAQAKPKLTVLQALTLLAGLRSLDGHQVAVKGANGQETAVTVPWEFNSGSLRATIAGDITLLLQVEKSTEDARQAIVREILAKMPEDKAGHKPTMIPPGSPEYEDFQKQYTELLNHDSPISEQLARIKVSKLKLDKNEISVTSLSALSPILDQDVAQ